MNYILALCLLIFVGCDENKDVKKSIKESVQVKTQQKIESKKPIVKIKKIRIKNFDNNRSIEFVFKNNKLTSIFKNKIVLLFLNKSILSKEQLSYMKKTKTEFFVVKNQQLIDYFNILDFPSLVILDKNKTKKYNSILPYEVLKIELKD